MADTGSIPEQEKPAPTDTLPDVGSVGVGPALRMRREQLGWTLPQVAAWLRIREPYLEALESGRAGVFPAEAYALGFLRTYAEALGFRPEDVVSRYKREGKGSSRKPELTFPAPPPDRRIPPGVSVSLGLAVIVAAYAGWYHFIGHAPPVPEHVPPVADIIPGEKTANAPSPQVASILPGAGTSPPPTPRSAPPVAPAAAAANSDAPGQSAAPVDPLASSPDFTKPAPNDMQQSGGVNPDGSANIAGHDVTSAVDADQLALKADAASWVQVKDSAGKVVYDHIMQPGDTWTVPKENGPYSLTVGNAGGVSVSAGAITTPHLGRNGAVRRKLVLTADAVRDGSLAGAPSASVVAPSSQLTGEVSPQSEKLDAKKAENTPAPTVEPTLQPAQSESHTAEQGAVVQENAPVVAPSQPVAPVRRRKPSPPPETSADDLNARQLQGLGGH
ncbi:DUF4115 domain-containing protein [Acetobacter indonesiensis]|uniref:helix-turn-helix domain-containing protein n=1 Tax=Acetobacter indonesiensis TaxID=104101 RepID=UPI001F1A7991|nr:helix-turn-helix domain-containing protein [Acetobacter indonesiensis]MCG0995672.1 DUF4115 domain-containing protein [Acetobacter indonesiensis]